MIAAFDFRITAGTAAVAASLAMAALVGSAIGFASSLGLFAASVDLPPALCSSASAKQPSASVISSRAIPGDPDGRLTAKRITPSSIALSRVPYQDVSP